ncbi:MAG: hypothetical protein AAGI23_09895 [Bacteroidota bacterium]
MIRWICLLAILIGSLTAQGQKDETLFSESGIRLTGAWGGPTLGATLVDSDVVRQSGAQFALEFNKNLLLGWRTHRVDFPNLDSRQIDFSYNGLFLNYAPAAHKAFHPSFGFFASGGHVGFTGQSKNEQEDILVAQPEIGFEINAFRWMKVNISGGYRFAYFTGDEFQTIRDTDLSAPFAHLAFKFGFSWGGR